MKKELFYILLLLLFSMTTTAQTTQTDFDYHLDWGGDRIHVTLHYTLPNPGDTILHYGNLDYGGQTDIFGCIKNLRAKGADITADSIPLIEPVAGQQPGGAGPSRAGPGQRHHLRLGVTEKAPDRRSGCQSGAFPRRKKSKLDHALRRGKWFSRWSSAEPPVHWWRCSFRPASGKRSASGRHGPR